MTPTIDENTLKKQIVGEVVRQTYTVAEAANILGISRTVAYRPGVLPTVKVGGRLLVPKQALERMLAGDIVSANAKSPTNAPQKLSGNGPRRTLPTDRRGAHRATSSRGRFSPVTGREKVCSRQLPKVVT